MEQQQQQQYIVDFETLKRYSGDTNLRIVQLGDEQIMQVPEEIGDSQQIVYQQTSPQQQQPQQIHQPQYVLQHTEQQIVTPQQQVYHQTHLRQQHVPQQIYYTSTPTQPQNPPPQIVYRTTQQSPPQAQQHLMSHNGQIIVQQQPQQQVIIQHNPQMQQQQQQGQQQRLPTQIPNQAQRIIYSPRVVFATQATAAPQQQQQQQQNQQIIRQHTQMQQIQPQLIQQRPATPQNQNIVFHSVQQHHTVTGEDQGNRTVVRNVIPQKLVLPNAISSVRAKPSILTPQTPQNNAIRITRPRGGAITAQRPARGRGNIVLTTPRPLVGQTTIRHQSPNAVKIADGITTKIVRTTNVQGSVRLGPNQGVRPKLHIKKTISGDDIEDNIQAVVVKKEEQTTEGATLTQYDNEEQKRIENGGSSISLVEYKQRQQQHQQQQQQQQRLQQVQRPPQGVQYRMPIASGQTTGQVMTARAIPVSRMATMVTAPPQNTITVRQPAQVVTEVAATAVPATSVMKTSHNNYEIHSQNVILNRTMQQQQTPNRTFSDVDKNSAKMLVILASGEQRLITFTLPKESCTVQDLLEQVGVPFDENTSIQCVESPGRDIDFVVTVGFNMQESPSDIISRAEQTLQNQQQQQQQQQQLQAAAAAAVAAAQQKQQIKVVEKPSPKPSVELPPRKTISGFLAVCKNCGFSGADHAKCERCKRVFTEEPKKVSVPPTKITVGTPNADGSPTRKANQMLQRGQIKAQNALAGQVVSTRGGRGGVGNKPGRGGRLIRNKPVEAEPIVFTLSSDEEDDENSKQGNLTANNTMSNSDSSFVEKPLACEPEIPEDDEELYIGFQRVDVTDLSDTNHKLSTSFECKIIRIGTYRIEEPKGQVTVTSKGLRMMVPSCSDQTEIVSLDILQTEFAKIVYHFSPNLNVFFLYTLKKCAQYIRESLDMKVKPTGGGIETPYFDPKNALEPYKRIVFVIKESSSADECKSIINSVFPSHSYDEITYADAITLLDRSSSKDKFVSLSNDTSTSLQNSQTIRQLLIYPQQGKGAIAINTEDYACLATEQYLNDIIIEFYLKWLYLEVLTEEQRQKTHIFSTFFYKRLTTVTQHRGEKMTAPQKRHARVQKWTKDVNLFEKDFIIVPINEQSHWFLAIICFPKLKGPVDYTTEQPIKIQPPAPKKKKTEKKKSVQIGSTTITQVVKKEEMTVTLEGDDSERDEAEGDESEMASEDSDTDSPPQQPQEQRIKQPIILIFDSLQGASRNRVVATLRDYLTCEYLMKEKQAGRVPASNVVFTKDNMQGHCVKCPQQNNFTDCGLFLLQYVEHFFKDPIQNYKPPIKQLVNWFENIVVTRKREDIANLIKDLIEKSENGKNVMLPEIMLPTLNGELVETEEGEERDENFEEDDENDPNFEVNSATSESPDKSKNVPTIGKKVVLKRNFKEVSDLQTNTPIAKKVAKIDTPTSS